MANFEEPTQTPGQDFRIWEEILYLDSPSDYREHLPQNSVRGNMRNVDLVMLDRRWPSRPTSVGPILPVAIIALVILASLGYFVYVF